MITIGVIGATGYTGVELLRILASHPEADVQVVTSGSEAGNRVSDVFSSLRGCVDLRFSEHDTEALKDCDLVFFATPNATAMYQAPALLKAGTRIIDLSADFRLQDAQIWSHWYGEIHACPELLADAVYGLPEINREKIKQANIVANPGCYPTAVTLALIPVLQAGIVEATGLIADAKSGVSGAGRKSVLTNQFCEVSETLKAYAVPGHRHLPEINQTLNTISGKDVDLTFVPHLIPMVRGIHATVYGTLISATTDLQQLYENCYKEESFVDVLPPGSHPDTRSTRGSNFCRIAVHKPFDSARLVVLSVIDNLVKGAAGQAVQNMNIMYGYRETMGLETPALYP